MSMLSLNVWVACSDQLPGSDTTVMTFDPNSYEPIWPGYHDGEHWQDIDGGVMDNITHWMAFPEPPETV